MTQAFAEFVGKTVQAVERLYAHADNRNGEFHQFTFTDGTQTVIAVRVETGEGFATAVSYPNLQAAIQVEAPAQVYTSLPDLPDLIMGAKAPDARNLTVRYLQTVIWLRRFEEELKQQHDTRTPDNVDERLWQAATDALSAKVEDLTDEASAMEQEFAGIEPICMACHHPMQPRRQLTPLDALPLPSGLWVCVPCRTAGGEPFHESAILP